MIKKSLILSVLSFILLTACSKGEFDACGKFPNGSEDSSYSVCLNKGECFIKEKMEGDTVSIYDLDGVKITEGAETADYANCMPTEESFFQEITN